MTSRTATQRRLSPTIRIAIQATRLLVGVSVMFIAGMLTSIAAAFLVGGSAVAFPLGAFGGLLLCLCPEIWHLVVLRIDKDCSGPVRLIHLRPALRTGAEHVPRWHPDNPDSKWL